MNKQRIGLVGAFPRMPHGHHQLGMLRDAAARQGVELIELDGKNLDEALARKESTGYSDCEGYVCFREDYTYQTALLDDSGNAPEDVARLKRKDEARQCLRDAGFEQPATAEEPRDIPGPWVVKPRSGSGSAGVSVHTELESAREALRTLSDGFAETFVQGTEFSAEGYFYASEPVVVGITDKRLEGVVEIGHRYPSVLLSDHEEEIAASVISALNTWGLNAGLFHVEGWWVDGQGVVLGEGHVRPGGDFIHLLVSSVHGANIFDPLIADALRQHGRKNALNDGFVFPQRRDGHSSAVRYIQVPPGTITAVSGVEEALSEPGILAGYCTAEPGVRVETASSSTERLGCLVAHACGGEDPEDILDRAMGKLRITVSN